ncbi:hypothetical protein MKX08_003696 [Trichoderma sp. CBMAI-0020]|nr:hypothetical protein MKX08_003696 [Trichoderma sp. CBMAI-0020]WOD46200.1 hypothetical protein [Trichoderma atroviride]
MAVLLVIFHDNAVYGVAIVASVTDGSVGLATATEYPRQARTSWILVGSPSQKLVFGLYRLLAPASKLAINRLSINSGDYTGVHVALMLRACFSYPGLLLQG